MVAARLTAIAYAAWRKRATTPPVVGLASTFPWRPFDRKWRSRQCASRQRRKELRAVLRGCHKRDRALSRVRAIVESPPGAYVTVSERAVRGHLRNETTCRVKTSRATYCRATPGPGRRALKGRRLRTEARPAPNHSPPNPSFRAGLPASLKRLSILASFCQAIQP